MHVAASSDGLTAKEISQSLGLSRPTTYHLIHTLVGEGFLTKGERRQYCLGLGVGTLAAAFGRQLAPPDYLLSHLRSLALKTGEPSYVAGWRSVEVVVLSHVPGRYPVNVSDLRIGFVGDAHARASGKLLLAFAPPEVRDEYLRTHPPRRRTPNTIVDRERLEHEFSIIRERRYATDFEEFALDVCCLAVPLDGGASPFVLSLSAPKERFAENFEAYLRAALETAQAASSPSLAPRLASMRGDRPG